MPCVCDAPCVEVDGAETCTLCGLERARWFGIPTNNDDENNNNENNKNENKNDNGENNKENKKKSGRRVAEYRRYVGSLAINETVAGEAVGLYERLVVARGLVFRGLRNVAVRLACVAAALDTTSSSVKHTAVVADTAECARYGYARLRRALDRALDAVLGPRACFVGASEFDVDVGAYQRAVAQLGCAHTLVRACTRLDAECFTPSERARYKDTNLQKAVLLSVATGPYDTVGRARLGLNARTATTVRRLIDRRRRKPVAISVQPSRTCLRVNVGAGCVSSSTIGVSATNAVPNTEENPSSSARAIRWTSGAATVSVGSCTPSEANRASMRASVRGRSASTPRSSSCSLASFT
jgi:hypothetical protein